jgi:hypothetical protein
VEVAMTPNDFLKILLEASNKCTDPAPKGWYSKNELCKIWNVKKTTCKERIAAGIKVGFIERKDFYIPNVNGTLFPVPHYYFLDKKPNKKTCIK